MDAFDFQQPARLFDKQLEINDELRAELATLREQIDYFHGENDRLIGENASLRAEIEQLHARIGRMRPAFPVPSKGALLLQTPSDHRLGSGPGDTDTTYREPKPVIRTRPML